MKVRFQKFVFVTTVAACCLFNFSAQAQPTLQANSITAAAATTTELRFDWASGNGATRIVVLKTGNGVFTPVNGQVPTASNDFGLGANISTGAGVVKCVYSGSGSSVNVLGLSP